MFGVLRTTLALMVMVYHLWGGPSPLGNYPVFGFYVISGYLMTRVMQERYGYSAPGRWAFAANRMLRLFPQYWAAAGLTLLLIAWLGSETVRGYNAAMFVPPNWTKAWCNILLVYPAWHAYDIRPRLVPPTWAVSVEMVFYALICFGLSRTLFRVLVWLVISIGYVAGTYLVNAPWEDRYFPVAAASLPFAVGAGMYFLSLNANVRDWFARTRLSASQLFALVLINGLTWMTLTSWQLGPLVDAGIYLNVVLFAGLVLSLALGGNITRLSPPTDQAIGDLSYPIYLFHWQAGLIATTLLYGEPFSEQSWRGLVSLVGSFVCVMVLAILSLRLIDQPVERIRASIRRKRSVPKESPLPPAETPAAFAKSR